MSHGTARPAPGRTLGLDPPLARRALPFALLAFAFVVWAPVQALPGDSAQELVIQANEAVYDAKTGVNVLTGQVRIEQGSLRVEAHRVTTTTDADDRLSRIVAEGAPQRPATLRQRINPGEPFVTARATRIDYAVTDGQLELQGEAVLKQGEREVGGDVVSWDIEEGRVSARANQPGGVTTKWQPKRTATAD